VKIIDIHTHFFPDEIAVKTVDFLEESGGIKAEGDGTLDSLRRAMKKDGISVSVNCPIATRPEQTAGINRKMAEHNSNPENKDVICFGTMHPDYEDAENEIASLAFAGIKGIKMHPEYQEFYPDDEKMKKIYSACEKAGLMILFHAGRDEAYESVHGTPGRFAAIEGEGDFILAHLGGYMMWEEIYEKLAGRNFYFDTALINVCKDTALITRIIEKHGSEKVLFGTDFPWASPAAVKSAVEKAVSNDNARENIFYGNAQRVLGGVV